VGSSLQWSLLGNLGGGGSFTGTFERKRECISGFQYIKTGETNCNAKITEVYHYYAQGI